MSSRFRSSRQGPTVKLSVGEVTLLGFLFRDLLDLLDSDRPEESAAVGDDPLAELTGMTVTDDVRGRPSDPALARLLPDAYRDDGGRAAEFRRFTEDELRTGKRARISVLLDSLPESGGRLVLPDEETVDAWLGALNDLRLALGTRLDVTEDTYEELAALDPESPRARELAVYSWLGWLQETLIDTVT